LLTVGARHGLAPDATLPGRDLLLDQDTAGEHLAGLLGREVTGCELVRVKYRIGESLRATYRVVADGQPEQLTVRAFRPGASGSAYRKAAGPGVWHDPALAAVWWAFPADRRLRGLADLLSPGPELAALAPGWVAGELVEYSPERAATFRALDATGAVLGYAKAYAPGTVDVTERSQRYARIAAVLAAGGHRCADTAGRVRSPLGAGAGADARHRVGPAVRTGAGGGDGPARLGDRHPARRRAAGGRGTAPVRAAGRPAGGAQRAPGGGGPAGRGGRGVRLADRLADGPPPRWPAGRAARRLPPPQRFAGRRLDRADRPRPGRCRRGRRGRRQPHRPADRRRRHRDDALGVPVGIPGGAAAAAGRLAALAHRRGAGRRAGACARSTGCTCPPWTGFRSC
jgi:hypothetical protein